MMKKLAILWIWAALLLGGCDDFLTSRDKSTVLENNLFTDREGVEDALYGIYAGLAKEELYGVYVPFEMDFLAQFYMSGNTALNPVLEYEHAREVSRGIANRIWQTMYHSISDINNFLANLDAYEGKHLEFDDIYRGEALGLRAYLHFDLLRIFAPVTLTERGIPYVRHFGPTVTSFSTVKECYDFIIADLQEAEKLLQADDTLLVLPRVRSNEFVIKRNREVHFNLYAVQATLARVYYMRGESGDLEKAGEYASALIGSEKFPLVSEPRNVTYMMGGVIAETEAIWGLSNSTLYSSLYSYYIARGMNAFDPAARQVRLYTEFSGELDCRRDWFRNVVATGDITRTVKLLDPVELGFTSTSPNGLKGVNQIRIAEMYLIAAEAALAANSPVAQRYLDDLVASRGMSRFVGTLTLDNIDKEWRKELVAEGQVWFQMKHRHPQTVTTVYGNELTMTEGMWQLLIPDDEFDFREDFTM